MAKVTKIILGAFKGRVYHTHKPKMVENCVLVLLMGIIIIIIIIIINVNLYSAFS